MAVVLVLLGAIAWLFAFAAFTTAAEAVAHQIIAGEAAIAGAVLIAGGCVVSAIDAFRAAVGRALATWAETKQGP